MMLGKHVAVWDGGEDPTVSLCLWKMITENPEAFHLQVVSVSAIHKPEVLIKMLLKEANQLTDTLQDGLFYLKHRKLLMSIMLPL